jgi:hypothetical protein
MNDPGFGVRWAKRIGSVIVLLTGVGGVFAWVSLASDPYRQSLRGGGVADTNLGAEVTRIAVPEALVWEAAVNGGDDRYLCDYEAYVEFLVRNGLERGVLVVEVSSVGGKVIYHLYPALLDPQTFSDYITRLPGQFALRQERPGWLRKIAIDIVPDEALATRSAADRALNAGELFPLPQAIATD